MDEYLILKLKKMSGLLKMGLFYMRGQDVLCLQDYNAANPLHVCEPLRKKLMQQADSQEEPYIYMDDYQVCFLCIKDKADGYFAAGPMSLKLLSRLELHQYYKNYGIGSEEEKHLRHFLISDVLDITGLLSLEIRNADFTYDQLMKANHFSEEKSGRLVQEQILFELKKEEEDLYHHTYQEERKLLECVRQGNVEQALLYSRNMDVDLGKLSANEKNHWKNVAVAAITLCTRAAIEGGLSPSTAYRVSDFYIQKADTCSDIVQIIECRNLAVRDLTARVQKQILVRSRSNYVERCKDYINNHYREKIYQETIAETLQISPAYLSRLFHNETGMRLQDYLVKVRLERAANLLLYSDERLARIAEYVNFPSQSYFGKMFKKYYHMSPKQYRDMHKPQGF